MVSLYFCKMKIKQWLIACIIICSGIVFAQPSIAQEKKTQVGFNVYNPYADAALQLKTATSKALKEKKHVLVIVGGNWCVWCKRLDQFLNNQADLQSALEKYEIVHLNYSKENKNEPILTQFNYPQQYGFPVLVVLNENGTYMMTQNTSSLEKGSGYDLEKIQSFLNAWNYNNINNINK